MTHVGAGTLPATSVPVWVSRAGVVCVAAGILGAVSGGPFVFARLAITVWMLLFVVVGYALWKADAR